MKIMRTLVINLITVDQFGIRTGDWRKQWIKNLKVLKDRVRKCSL